MNQIPQHLFEFGPFQLDTANHLLLRQGQPVPLPPKAFDTLVLLVERRGALLEREVLISNVWPDTFVEENNVTHYISMLRKALGEGENGTTFIETVPKLGYRFVAPVREIPNGQNELLLAKYAKTRIVVHEEEEEEESRGPADIAHSSEPIVRVRAAFPARNLLWWGFATVVVALLAVGAVAYLRRAPKLTDRDSILLADFENSTGEPVFDSTLKRALALKLEESPYLNMVSDQRVRESLRFMGRSPDEKLTPALAREICQRRGVKALLSGSVARLGSQYVISLEASNCESGDLLARVQVNAANQNNVLPALGSAISSLRGKLGESLRSIEKFDVPIQEATTPSLEALKAFSLGEALRFKGQQIEAIPFFERAIDLDPDFAIAYGRLGALYLGIGEPDRASEYSQKAFQSRQHSTERERLILTAAYYHTGIGDFEKAIAQYEVWKQSYPQDFIPHLNLAALYNDAGQFDRALIEGRNALRLNPIGHALIYNTTGWAALRSNQVAEARAIFEKAVAEKFDNTMMHRGLYGVAFLQGDSAVMQRESAAVAGKPDEYRSLMFEAQAAAYSGKLRESRGLYRRGAELALKNHFADAAAAITAGLSLTEASFGNVRQSREAAARSLGIAHGKDALGIIASSSALSGDTSLAEKCIAELGGAFPDDTLVNSVAIPASRAALELRSGNADRAIEFLHASSPYELGPMVFGQGYLAPYLRGEAYLSAGKSDDARQSFQHILDNSAAAPFAPLKALAHLGLARTFLLAGDRNHSRLAYEEFFALWKDADPDIPIFQLAKAEYAKLQKLNTPNRRGVQYHGRPR